MIAWQACVMALGFVLTRSAPAQTLDYSEAVIRSEPVSAAVSEIAAWVTTINPTELKLQYDEGHNLAFWIEEADIHAARVDSAIRVLATHPRLDKLVYLVIDTHQLTETIFILTRELSDCHTCDAASVKRAGSWAANVRDRQRQLSKTLTRLEDEMRRLVIRAETLAERPTPERLKD